MIFGSIVLLVALCISAVAAYYSIVGLTAIFAAAVMPIIIMGAILEVGKVAATVWLHMYWRRAGLQFKLYLVPAIGVLMLITSMGIFGFLSKAHMDQTVPAGDVAAQVQIFDEKIKTQRDNIESARAALKQMDDQVNQLLSRTTDDKGAQKAAQLRKQQTKERKQWQADIATAQTEIVKLQNERAPIAAEVRKVEAEVGPIKYIAALIYGDSTDNTVLESAVRWVIILLVFVFDPLAIVLILAGEQTIKWGIEDRKRLKQEAHIRRMQELEEKHQEMLNEAEFKRKMAELEQQNVIILDDEARDDLLNNLENPPELSSKLVEFAEDYKERKEMLSEEEFFARGKEIAQELDEQMGYPLIEDENVLDKHPYLAKPWVWGNREKLPPVVAKVETQDWTDEDIDRINQELLVTDEYDEDHEVFTVEERPPVKTVKAEEYDAGAYYAYLDEKVEEPVVEEKLDPRYDPPSINPAPAPVIIPDLSIGALHNDVNTRADFGTSFPDTPVKGDLFLRVDYLPSKLYKWNGKKWIEVDKEITNRFAYDEEYIKHLVEKLQSGEYELDMLSDIEQEQVSRYLNEQINKQ